MRESTIEKYFVKRVKALGGQTRKVQWIGRSGAPDRLAVVPGRALFWVEFKAPGEQLRKEQQEEHKMLKDGGAFVVVIDSIEGVNRLLG